MAGARHVSINSACYRTVKVQFSRIGKARWPFGWEILRQLSYPEGYRGSKQLLLRPKDGQVLCPQGAP